MEFLIPRRIISYMGKEHSFFPLLRIIVPDIDVSRPHTGMKESTIAVVWGTAMGKSNSVRGVFFSYVFTGNNTSLVFETTHRVYLYSKEKYTTND